MPSKEDLIKGYLEELRQAEQRQDATTAKAVKEELKALGFEAKPPAARAETRETKPKK